MRKAPVVAAVFGLMLVCGCVRSNSPVANGSPPPSRSLASSAVQSSNTVVSTPSGSPSVASIHCRLPAISALDLARGDNPARGGFVGFPGGQFTPDPRAAAAGAGRPVYDPAIQDWLPEPKGDVWRQYPTDVQLAPDGISYVYESARYGPANPSGPNPPPSSLAVHVANARTGSDVVVYQSGPPFFNVLGYAPPTIFLTPACIECGAGGSNLWSLDERTGSLRKISDLSSYWSIVGGVAWGGVTTTTSSMDRLVRVDGDGTTTTWLTQPGVDLRLLAMGSDGSALVTAQSSNSEAVWRVTQPARGEEVFVVASGGLSGAFTDGYGTWIGGAQAGDGAGIFLYTASGGLQRMSDFPGVPLGGCI